jgi:hypothetical protein
MQFLHALALRYLEAAEDGALARFDGSTSPFSLVTGCTPSGVTDRSKAANDPIPACRIGVRTSEPAMLSEILNLNRLRAVGVKWGVHASFYFCHPWDLGF